VFKKRRKKANTRLKVFCSLFFISMVFAGCSYTTNEDSSKTNAATPVIGTQPADASYTVGAAATAVSVSASVSDGGTLTYQWYSAVSASGTGTAVSGATSAVYTPDTTTAGTYYYYCVVTNTNSSVTGTKTASVTSSVATIKVTSSSGTGGISIQF
jgi:hypothetical protein